MRRFCISGCDINDSYTRAAKYTLRTALGLLEGRRRYPKSLGDDQFGDFCKRHKIIVKPTMRMLLIDAAEEFERAGLHSVNTHSEEDALRFFEIILYVNRQADMNVPSSLVSRRLAR